MGQKEAEEAERKRKEAEENERKQKEAEAARKKAAEEEEARKKREEEEAAAAAAEEIPEGCYSLQQLQDNWRELGVPADARETFLPPRVFKDLFGMEKDAFAALPKWKKDGAKKKHKLF